MSDEVFEAWYKTSEMFRNAIKNNKHLADLAQEFNTEDEDLKRAITKFQRTGATPGQDVLVELVFSLNIDTAQPSNCMCCYYNNLGMDLSEHQQKIWGVVLNRLYGACTSTNDKGPFSIPVPPKHSLTLM